MLSNIEGILTHGAKLFPLKQLAHTRNQPSNIVSYNIMERSTRRNVRYDPFGDYPPAYGPVAEDLAKMDGVISCASVSVGGPVDGRFLGTIQLELEQDSEDNSPRCMEVGRQLRKCLDRYGVHLFSVHSHVAGKHMDAKV
jgi:hypothetical protein